MVFGNAIALINGNRKESSFTGILGREADNDDSGDSADERENSSGSE
jgi:hypothetical protein